MGSIPWVPVPSKPRYVQSQWTFNNVSHNGIPHRTMYWEARNPQQVYSYYPRYYIDVCEHELDSTLDTKNALFNCEEVKQNSLTKSLVTSPMTLFIPSILISDYIGSLRSKLIYPISKKWASGEIKQYYRYMRPSSIDAPAPARENTEVRILGFLS
ncbi:hypothetical protein AO1008_00328 [Aspergillus oryzae 100-8]|uniref:Uncharacterized protein n=1 Tax=Aspergillus oryzae (strain 3.042) TaxID=1160506 RepID=I7ZT81_ASPO3|nr:hypothetical protein Ao3042_09096 [Aspergillus oryzae 3.042]KDE85012.1 hypothetical protein AO1008_00328 [Aspergillus oryzae 100-8]|eukprot:EIT75249.1 hypothetical protein Ao3042_09096 [Aspergillus oryzae 3.042]